MSGRGRGGRGRHIRRGRRSAPPPESEEKPAEGWMSYVVLYGVLVPCAVIAILGVVMIHKEYTPVELIDFIRQSPLILGGIAFVVVASLVYCGLFLNEIKYALGVLRNYLAKARRKCLKIKKKYSWLRNYLSWRQLRQHIPKYLHEFCKLLFQAYILVLGIAASHCLVMGKPESGWFLVNFYGVVAYFLVGFFYFGFVPENIILHFGVLFFQAGLAALYLTYEDVAFISISVAAGLCLLYIIWPLLRRR